MTHRILAVLIFAIFSLRAEEKGFEPFGDAFEAEFTAPAPEEEFDPLAGYNRMMTRVNDTLYTSVLFPVARGYEAITPDEGRKALSRFFDNLRFPVRFVNNLLQWEIKDSAEELARFVVNTTLGIGGFFDPATTWLGLKSHPEDFGQTLGRYGVGGGFHIVLPLLGPSNLRDTLSILPDRYVDPAIYWSGRSFNFPANADHATALSSLDTINRAAFDYRGYESLKKDAVDLYPFLKNVYEQSRKKAIEE